MDAPLRRLGTVWHKKRRSTGDFCDLMAVAPSTPRQAGQHAPKARQRSTFADMAKAMALANSSAVNPPSD
jgi:ABC-type transport system involved in cytochrome bd biosynthesis fused ATPase/permease subunit